MCHAPSQGMHHFPSITSCDLERITGGRGVDPRIEAKSGALDFIAGGGPAGPARPQSGGAGGGGGGGGKGWLLDPQASRDMMVY
jgi:hypothetical protein